MLEQNFTFFPSSTTTLGTLPLYTDIPPYNVEHFWSHMHSFLLLHRSWLEMSGLTVFFSSKLKLKATKVAKSAFFVSMQNLCLISWSKQKKVFCIFVHCFSWKVIFSAVCTPLLFFCLTTSQIFLSKPLRVFEIDNLVYDSSWSAVWYFVYQVALGSAWNFESFAWRWPK